MSSIPYEGLWLVRPGLKGFPPSLSRGEFWVLKLEPGKPALIREAQGEGRR